jgi:serine/threonine-protein kinase
MSLPDDKRVIPGRVPPPVPDKHAPAHPPNQANRNELAVTQIGAAFQVTPGGELPVGMPVGEYRIEGKIGEGGMATVYSALHPLIGKKAAIKVMSPALGADAIAVERFVQEARAVNQIGHPNIVDIFSFGKLPDGRNYFVMEWLQGETLHSRLERGPIELSEIVEILLHVCDALEAAHEKGIVHRDLKPENIFLVERRPGRKQVKLLDFGIAKLTGNGVGKVVSTSANMVMGTPQYISPEQALAKNVDHRTDIYSLGALAFEMVLGRPPFTSESVMAIVAMHLSEPIPRPSSLRPDVAPPIEEMLVGMLEKEASKRPSLARIRELLAITRERHLPRGADGALVSQTLLYGDSQPIQIPPHLLVAPAAATPQPTPTPASAEPTAGEAEPLDLVRSPARGRALMMGGAVGAIALLAVILLARSAPEKALAPALAPAPAAAPLPPPAPARAAEPAPAPAIVVINTNVDDARIELDGKVAAEAARNARLEVAQEGEHEIVVSAAGRKLFRKRFSASPGAILEIPVTLKSASSPSASRLPKSKPKKNDDSFYMLDPLGKNQVR